MYVIFFPHFLNMVTAQTVEVAKKNRKRVKAN